MPLRVCKDCNDPHIGRDRKSGKYWCSKCKEVKEDYKEIYKIAILGKNTGKKMGANNYIKGLGRAWRKTGHEVVEISVDELVNYVPEYYFSDTFQRKKKIPLKFIEYYHSPDFIMIEQTYNRFDIDDVKCPVIYQHREYTHFPDVENPDILLGSYPHRTDVFELYFPYEFHKIPYVDECYVAVDPELFKPVEEKVFKGLTYLGWASPPMNFYTANGILAKAVIYDQMEFIDECSESGFIRYMEMGKGHDYYVDVLGKCEAIVLDCGFVNGIGRTLFEAMMSKTAVFLKVHHPEQLSEYKQMGLEGKVVFFSDVEELKDAKIPDGMVEEAYKWVLENHTYDIRAGQVLEKFEEFKSGITKRNYIMGYSVKFRYVIEDGKVIISEEK